MLTPCESFSYETHAVLGSGGEATVFGGKNILTGEDVAIKVVPFTRERSQDWVVLRAVGEHENLIPYPLSVSADNTRGKRFIVMKRYDGDVHGYIADANRLGLSEAAARPLFLGMMRSLRHLWRNGWCHGDVKLDNFLMKTSEDGIEVVLSDFGFSESLPAAQLHRAQGYFCPPEAQCCGYSLPYDGTSADIWSLGVCLVAMLSCHLVVVDPWQRSCRWDESIDRTGSPELIDLLHRMVQWDPRDRPSFEDIASHPWVVGHRDPDCLSRSGSAETFLASESAGCGVHYDSEGGEEEEETGDTEDDEEADTEDDNDDELAASGHPTEDDAEEQLSG